MLHKCGPAPCERVGCAPINSRRQKVAEGVRVQPGTSSDASGRHKLILLPWPPNSRYIQQARHLLRPGVVVWEQQAAEGGVHPGPAPHPARPPSAAIAAASLLFGTDIVRCIPVQRRTGRQEPAREEPPRMPAWLCCVACPPLPTAPGSPHPRSSQIPCSMHDNFYTDALPLFPSYLVATWTFITSSATAVSSAQW